MRKGWISLFALATFAGGAPNASAQRVELAFFGGWTVPTYEQAFTYSPSLNIPPIPGVSIQQQGSFQLKAKGAAAFGGSLTFYPVDFFGFEARVDSVDFQIDTVAPSFFAGVDLPPPIGSLNAELDLSEGEFEVDRVNPVSLNLRLRTPGPAKFFVSGGFSYLPELVVTARQTVGLGVIGGNFVSNLDIGSVGLIAEALPADLVEADGGRWGANAGAGFQVLLSNSIGLMGEARAFRFSKQRFVWQGAQTPSSEIERQILAELEDALPVIAIEPIFFHAVIGVFFRF